MATFTPAPEPIRKIHEPVLMDHVLEQLAIAPGATVVDATAGAGGHLLRLIEATGERGSVVGIDRDDRAFAEDAAGGVVKRFPGRAQLVKGCFSEIKSLLDKLTIENVDGLLADIGVSSMQLDEAARGFSFQSDAPLDMRMDQSCGLTAAELIAECDEVELADLIYKYGEERASRRIAKSVKRCQPTTTLGLVDAVTKVMPRRGRIHPATRTFQALRIAVNGELDELESLLAAIPDILGVGGRAAIISFHSLEDRIVKHTFRAMSKAETPKVKVLTKKPLIANDEERKSNPRSRSAKLRVVERI